MNKESKIIENCQLSRLLKLHPLFKFWKLIIIINFKFPRSNPLLGAGKTLGYQNRIWLKSNIKT